MSQSVSLDIQPDAGPLGLACGWRCFAGSGNLPEPPRAILLMRSVPAVGRVSDRPWRQGLTDLTGAYPSLDR